MTRFARFWKPRLGWWTTAALIIGGGISAVFDPGFRLAAIALVAAGVLNAAGLLWWPGRITSK